MLQEVRIGQLSEKSKSLIQNKIDSSNFVRTFYETTHVVGLRNTAENINIMICGTLPFDEMCNDAIISTANDMLNFDPLGSNHNINEFRYLTNLPGKIHLQEGARVMFLNNKLYEHGICNGTIGVVTKIIDCENVEVAFSNKYKHYKDNCAERDSLL